MFPTEAYWACVEQQFSSLGDPALQNIIGCHNRLILAIKECYNAQDQSLLDVPEELPELLFPD
jgi:hypothetical protein